MREGGRASVTRNGFRAKGCGQLAFSGGVRYDPVGESVRVISGRNCRGLWCSERTGQTATRVTAGLFLRSEVLCLFVSASMVSGGLVVSCFG